MAPPRPQVGRLGFARRPAFVEMSTDVSLCGRGLRRSRSHVRRAPLLRLPSEGAPGTCVEGPDLILIERPESSDTQHKRAGDIRFQLPYNSRTGNPPPPRAGCSRCWTGRTTSTRRLWMRLTLARRPGERPTNGARRCSLPSKSFLPGKRGRTVTSVNGSLGQPDSFAT